MSDIHGALGLEPDDPAADAILTALRIYASGLDVMAARVVLKRLDAAQRRPILEVVDMYGTRERPEEIP